MDNTAIINRNKRDTQYYNALIIQQLITLNNLTKTRNFKDLLDFTELCDINGSSKEVYHKVIKVIAEKMR